VQLLIAMMEHDFWPMIPTIKLPALIIAGENDIYPPETHKEVHRLIPGSRLVIEPGCSHLFMREKPDVYVAKILEFIDND